MKALRLAQIGGVEERANTICQPGPPTFCDTSYSFWFTDSNNGYRSPDYNYHSVQKRPPDARGDAQRAREDYYNGKSWEIDGTLQSEVYDVASKWDVLVSNPVPQS